ncbi:MAG: Plug domain-containing protein [Methylacidiphilales bacterium]|nr:Plug domain-containing protein [Candidatus Methylacidiphilales bacterium]
MWLFQLVKYRNLCLVVSFISLFQVPFSALGADEEVEIIGRVIDNGSSATTFSIEEASQVPGGRGDILSAIQIISGVSPPQANSFGPDQGYYIRGSNLVDNQYIVDWLPVGYIFHFGGSQSYSVVNSSLIEGFDVILGGFSSKYANAVGGVIDVRLRNPREDTFHHEYRFGTEIGFLLEGPLSETESFWFAARRSYLDFFLKNLKLNTGVTFTQFPKFYDIQARLHSKTENGFVDFTVIKSDDTTGILFEKTDDPTFLGAANFSRGFTVAGVRWIENVGGWYQSSQYVNLYENTSFITLGTQTAGANDPEPGKPYGIDTKLKGVEVLSRHEFYLNEKNQFFIGVDTRKVFAFADGYITAPPSNDTGSQFPGLIKTQKTSANERDDFLSIEPYWTYTYTDPAVLVSIGTRGINVALSNNVAKGKKYYYSGFSDRYRLEFPFPDVNAKAYILYGTYVQLQDDIYLTETFGQPGVIDLIKTQHQILGFSGTNQDGLFWKVELWNKPTERLGIQPVPGCIKCVVGTAIGKASGIDVEFRKTYSRDSSLYVALSRSSGKRKNSNSEASYPYSGDQPNSFNLAFGDVISSDSNWTWGIRSILHDGQPFTRVIGRSEKQTIQVAGKDVDYYLPVYEGYKESRLPLFFQFDFGFTYKERDSNWSYKIELVSASDLIRPNTSGYDYGDNYVNYNNPKEQTSGNFFPTFIIEGKF